MLKWVIMDSSKNCWLLISIAAFMSSTEEYQRRTKTT